MRPRDVGDALYLTTRAKYHFGVPWSHAERLRFQPLYSPAAIKAAHALSDEDKADYRLGFEIMRRFSPALVNLPFANKAWSARLVASPPKRVTAKTPWLAEPGTPAAPRRTRPPREMDDVERKLYAAGKKAHVVNFGAALREFLAQDRDYGVLNPLFDADAVKRFMERSHSEFLQERYDVNNAYRIIGACIWASEIEIRDEELEWSRRTLVASSTP